MMTLQSFQSRLAPGQLDILSAVEANAVIGGGGCKTKSTKQKSAKTVKQKSSKSSKSNKNNCYCPPPPCY